MLSRKTYKAIKKITKAVMHNHYPNPVPIPSMLDAIDHLIPTKGDRSLLWEENPNIVFWRGTTEDVIDVINRMMREGFIVFGYMVPWYYLERWNHLFGGIAMCTSLDGFEHEIVKTTSLILPVWCSVGVAMPLPKTHVEASKRISLKPL
jgi:hypothetical protein